MRLKMLVLLLIGMIQQGFAEKGGSISGKVLDKKDMHPIGYATIVLASGGKTVGGGVTDEKGNFSVKNLDLMDYDVEVQYMGYKAYKTKISLNNENKSASLKVMLEEDATQLKEVTVVSEKSTIEQKTDRRVINVGKDLLSVGTTASELMNNIPSVKVDPQTNAISLRGNTNVKILVDGKPSNIDPAQLLQQIPSSSIKQIELITNPSAKYNPEGMSGIINIILNKNSRLGLNGSVNNGVTQGKTPKVNSSFDLNYKAGKVNLFANYGLNHGKYANYGEIDTKDANAKDHQDFSFSNLTTSHLAKLGLDYQIDEKNTFSFYTNQNISSDKGISRVLIGYLEPVKPSFLQEFSNKNENYNQTYNFDLKHNFSKEGHSLEFEANLSSNKNEEFANFSQPKSTNDVNIKGKNQLFNLDYTNPLNATTKLELGLEARLDDTKNNIDINSVYDADFEYARKIYSGYFNYAKQWGKWSGQVGGRLEHFGITGDFRKVGEPLASFSDDMVNFYPSAFLSYTPNDNHSFNFSVSRRVDRPSIDQLNPIREWSTPQIDSKGNPELKPQFTNSFEVNYTKKTKIGSISAVVFYRQIQQEIVRSLAESPYDPNKLILSYNNLTDNNAYGIELSSNLDFTKWYSANISFDGYSKKIKGVVANENVEIDVTTFNSRITNTFKPTKKWRIQLSGMYRGRDLNLQFAVKPMWKIDFGTSYTVLDGQGTISARVSDIFDSMHFAFDRDKPKLQSGQFHWENQTAYLGFNYRFGSGKNRAAARKERDRNETQKSGGLL